MSDTEWGPFLKFKEPVDWSNLRIIHDPDIALSGLDGYSADSYRGVWRSEIGRKYTLVSLMHKGFSRGASTFLITRMGSHSLAGVA